MWVQGSEGWVLGSQPRDKGSQRRDQGSQLRDQGSQPRDKGSQRRDQGSQAMGSGITNPGISDYSPGIRDHSPSIKIKAPGSEITAPGSGVTAPGSGITARGSGITGHAIGINHFYFFFGGWLISEEIRIRNVQSPASAIDNLLANFIFSTLFSTSLPEQKWRRGCLVVCASDFRCRSRWFEPGHCRRAVSLVKKLYFTLSVFTQVYKWVPAIIIME